MRPISPHQHAGMRNIPLRALSEPELRDEPIRIKERSIVQHSTAAQALVAGYRLHGYRAAAIDPLGVALREPAPVDELDPRSFGLQRDDPASFAVDFAGDAQTFSMPQLLHVLQESYCGTLALDSGHLRSREQCAWLYAQMERRLEAAPSDRAQALRILEQLVAAEAFEHYQRAVHRRHKQFSLEGCESLVPLMDALIEAAAGHGVEDVVVGMAHRGRLNLLLNVFGLTPHQLLSLFSERPDATLAAWDLKDHLGCSTHKQTSRGEIRILLAHNPSHLGAVAPVVCGMARALQDRKTQASSRRVMPVLMHGDAAFPGQGIVAETLNLSQTRGYSVGGTIHVIVNNQIGSTISDPRDSRSTMHCADLARAVDAPIVHVNADDPEAVVAAARMGAAFRARFATDIVVNLVGYRRPGHFGGDDPTMTQPAMQRRIRNHRSAPHLYAETLADRGMPADYEQSKAEAVARLAAADASLRETIVSGPPAVHTRAAAAPQNARTVTAVPIQQLRAIVGQIARKPAGMVLHDGVQKIVDKWQALQDNDELPVDWCFAESLAYGSLLATGFNVRLTGLDVGRGSFFHRHAVWHDQRTDVDGQNAHVPLRHLGTDQGYFSIFESPLSEEAVLGFEYGYALHCGRDLVVWEAQFGDFVNNAQTIIDQFIASGECKWGYANGLVMFLPHGNEGGGAEHSSGFLGRFLQLCGDDNLRIAVPSTASQLYHLLRRQALADRRKPLVVMTPKFGMHNLAASFSPLAELANGEFQPLIDDQAAIDPQVVTRAVVTSGKFYYDLQTLRAQRTRCDVAILRLEELYPFPSERLAQELARFPRLRSVVWAQEEARNHGAWHLLRDELEALLPPGVTLMYSARPAAAPAAGCDPKQHAAEQRQVALTALGPE
jgi:2-oxoglutarate dehydrogenase E1 component